MPQQVVVVGAGPGGLAAALLLARAGLSVRVVERLPRVGGRCGAVEAEGFRWDLGPTFFLYPLVLERIFKLVGRDLHAEVPMTRLDPQYRLVFGAGGQLDCTSDPARMREEIARLAPADAPHLGRFLAENRAKMDGFRPILERPFLGWRDLLSWDLLKMLPVLRPWNSVEAELGRYFADPRVRLAFTFQSKYLGMSPFNCPSLFSILSFLEYEYGVWHPTGGCAAVSEAMARVARELGVEFSLGEPVEELLFEGNRAAGVRTAAGEYRADAVVMNADFAHAMTKLVPDHRRRRWTDAKLDRKTYSCSTFMLYLGLDGPPPDLPHHTIYTAADYMANLGDITERHVLTDDTSFYVQNAGVTDPTLAPPGKSTLYVLAPVTHKTPNVDWKREAPRFRAQLLKQLGKIGLSDIEGRIRVERVVTPDDWEGEYAVYKGATFNLAHTLGQMLHLRPRNRFEDVPGVYLVGGGTHPGSGLPVIYESARITSRLVLGDLGRETAWLGAPGGEGATVGRVRAVESPRVPGGRRMSYRDFKFPKVADDLGLTLDSSSLFAGVAPLVPRPEFASTLDRGTRLARAVSSEKARSEFVIAPILLEVVALLDDRYSVFSGVEFNVDPARGLTGFCDFLLSRDPFQYVVRAPVVAVAEVKNDEANSGFGQCIAGMRAAWLFNAEKGVPVSRIYGAATTGIEWKFLRLRDTSLTIDADNYLVNDLGKILAILVHMAETA